MGNSQSDFAAPNGVAIHKFYSRTAWIEGRAEDQLTQIARLPGVSSIAAFPDLHPGKYGPVGCAVLSSRLHPQLVGSDIGCGMSLFALDMPARKLKIDKAAARLRRLNEVGVQCADRLVAAGADAMAITSIGGHFCVDTLRPRCPLPLLELPEAINAEIAARGLKKVGLLGTDTVMETGIYGGVTAAETIAPVGERLAAVHEAYTDMATKVAVTEAQRALFFEEGRAMTERGAEAILLAGTDLFVAFEGHDPGFDAIDCAEIHVAAIVKAILAAE